MCAQMSLMNGVGGGGTSKGREKLKDTSDVGETAGTVRSCLMSFYSIIA